MIYRNARLSATIGVAAIAIFLLSACAPHIDTAFPEAAARNSTAQTTQAPDPTIAPVSPTPAATAMGAAAAFRDWLGLSRIPDTAAACAGLSPELATRMIAELNEHGPVRASSCDEMIAVTAVLSHALGQDMQVEVSVRQETAADATLFVTSLATGTCRTIVMTRPADSWIITDQAEGCIA